MFAPLFCQNESLNQTNITQNNITQGNITDSPWHKISGLEGPTMTTLTILIVLVVAYILGKIAFRILKWVIIITLLILIFQILF